jgi:hypothetical protein
MTTGRRLRDATVVRRPGAKVFAAFGKLTNEVCFGRCCFLLAEVFADVEFVDRMTVGLANVDREVNVIGENSAEWSSNVGFPSFKLCVVLRWRCAKVAKSEVLRINLAEHVFRAGEEK